MNKKINNNSALYTKLCNRIQHHHYIFLIIWIVALISIGMFIGSLTKPEINSWYDALNRSQLTPANYIFPIAWTILYAIIGTCGWIIWRAQPFPHLRLIKTLYIIHLVLNWSWTPLFFHYHAITLSFFVLSCMDILIGILMMLTYKKLPSVSLLMIPYLLWILFASYLNFYIEWFN